MRRKKPYDQKTYNINIKHTQTLTVTKQISKENEDETTYTCEF